MKIYNTKTRRKEEFKPINEGKVGIYVCGPTVYDYIHIGNARPMIVFDTLRRYFEHKGYEVNYVSNFTDVEDKIIKRSLEEGISASEVSEKYIAECKKDMEALNVRPATTHPQATQEIPEMIQMVQTLIDKGHAYEKNGTVYFRVRSFAPYGKLSHKKIDDLESGHRADSHALKVTGEDEKEDALDFVLWKPKKEGEPFWESPWSEGRPGWHLECSCMSKKYVGDTIDIHAGGEDLIFPHHENEIAQSEAANGVEFANYWMHNAFLKINGDKMSKSLGNFFTVREIADKYDLRVIMLITPETSEERIRFIDENTDGFIYMVSSAAITGAQKSFDEAKQEYFRRIDAMNLRNPRMIGFGISNRQTLESAQQNAAGAIIGSKFVVLLEEAQGDADVALDRLYEALAS